MELADRPACVARSSVVARTRTAIEEASKGGGLGQLFSELGGKQEFSLLEVARAETTFSRVYVLSNAHLVCHIEEVMPLNLFEDAFLAGPAWDADGVFSEGERGGFASSR